MPPPAPDLPAARYVDLPGRGRTWVYDTGTPAAGPGGPPIVLLHGWTSSAALNWYRCFKPLSERHRVVALDHRGHGRGIRSRRPFTLEACADDTAALIGTLGEGPAVVVGYSMGGPVAQLLWKRHPQTVRGLVLCATAPRFGVRPELTGMLGLAGFGLSLALTGIPYDLRSMGLRYVLRNRAGLEDAAPWAMSEWERNDPAAIIQAGVALGRFDSTPWIGGIGVPVAVVVTTLDDMVSARRQRWLAELIPGSFTYDVEGSHRACVDQAKLFVPALVSACERVAAASATDAPEPEAAGDRSSGVS